MPEGSRKLVESIMPNTVFDVDGMRPRASPTFRGFCDRPEVQL
jgi:hypothetical protein